MSDGAHYTQLQRLGFRKRGHIYAPMLNLLRLLDERRLRPHPVYGVYARIATSVTLDTLLARALVARGIGDDCRITKRGVALLELVDEIDAKRAA